MLKKYDNKLVRIIDNDNNIYEGIANYDSDEYNYHEYGVEEESMVILHHIFYKSDIKYIECINEYSSSYGKLEEMIINDDIDFIRDILEDDNEEVIRLRECINNSNISNKEEIIKLLDEFDNK